MVESNGRNLIWVRIIHNRALVGKLFFFWTLNMIINGAFLMRSRITKIVQHSRFQWKGSGAETVPKYTNHTKERDSQQLQQNYPKWTLEIYNRSANRIT